MAPYQPAELVLEVANRWEDRCLLKDGPALTDKSLWTPHSIDYLDWHFVKILDYGEGAFLKRSEGWQRPRRNLTPEELR